MMESRPRPTAPRYLVTTSWDDGPPQDLRVAELLAKYDLQGTFYVPLNPGSPVLAEREIRSLASQFEIGAHSVRHVPLTHLALEEARREMSISRAEIERITGQACPMFCFPLGKYNAAHLKLAGEAGFQACRTVAMFSMAAPAPVDDILLMPTTVQVYPHNRWELVRNLARRAAFRGARNWLRAGLQSAWPDLARTLLDHTLEHGGVFHLWGHSAEIDENGEWARLENFLQYLARRVDQANCVTNSDVCRQLRGAAFDRMAPIL